jgi:hypothetical protein
MPEQYFCRYGCQTQYPITTLRGWKRHMTAKHGKYSNAEMIEASSGSAPTSPADRMADFAAALDSSVPVEIAGDGSIKETPQGATTEPASIPLPPLEPATRKVRATPRRMKEILAGIPAKLLESMGITPDDDDKRGIDEAADFLQDVFGVDFEVDEVKTTVRSRWWAFAWVGGVMLLIVVKHKMPDFVKQAQAASQEAETPTPEK